MYHHGEAAIPTPTPEQQQKQASVVMDHVTLVNDHFDSAFVEYLTETKPDRLAKQQLESLVIDWTTASTSSRACPTTAGSNERDEHVATTTTSTTTTSSSDIAKLPFSPTHDIRGCVRLTGRHVTLLIQSDCFWRNSSSGDSIDHCGDQNEGEKKDGATWLYFRMEVSAYSGDKPSIHDRHGTESNRLSVPIMDHKLRSDPLIRRLLNDERPHLFCEASIHATKDQLEERVYVSEEVAEGVRRAILSRLESSLDVVELLVSLPCLPTTTHKAYMHATCQLADRAKLRLLEDALFDACEKEGEDEILEDLRITHSAAERQTTVIEPINEEKYTRPMKKTRSD